MPEQVQINSKHDTFFKTLNIENIQNTNMYTKIRKAEDGNLSLIHI